MEDYAKFLEELETTFQEFKEAAEAGKKTKASALRARKLSLKLRTDLQGFREKSLENDKFLTEAKKAKKAEQG